MINAISIFLSLGFYLWTIFGLKKMVLKKSPIYSYNEFKKTYPKGQLYSNIHNVTSIFAFLFFLCAGSFLGYAIAEKDYQIAIGMPFIVSGWNLFNGFFELSTKVCPAYGILIKWHRSQYYLTGNNVQKLGVIRVILSIFIVSMVFIFAI